MEDDDDLEEWEINLLLMALIKQKYDRKMEEKDEEQKRFNTIGDGLPNLPITES